MLDYDARDPALLHKHNITCVVKDECERNIVSIGRATDRSDRGLLLSYAGSRNLVRLHAGVPNGSMHFVGSNARCEMAEAELSVTMELWFYDGAKFSLGRRTSAFGVFAAIYNNTSLSIGDECLFSDQISIWTSDHHSIIDLETGEQINHPADIKIGNRVWISQGAHILKGVEIGDGSIVGAKSVVNCSIPRTELWAGVPAKPLKKNVSWVGSHPAHKEAIAHMRAALGIA
jgi:acetyltransferase-like isoleucine patch superfamily enzyme